MDQFGQFCAENNGQQNFQKGFPGADNIKQEMMYSPQSDFDMKMKMGAQQKMPPFNKGGQGVGPQQGQGQGPQGNAGGGMNQQPFSPYGSPGQMSNHGSPAGGPGFMGNRGAGGAPGSGTGGAGGGPQAAGPPRPASGGHPHQQTTLQMKQSQQLHITQQGMGHGLQVSGEFKSLQIEESPQIFQLPNDFLVLPFPLSQVSAGQNVHVSGDFKNSHVSVASNQGVFFNNHPQSQQQQNGQNNNPTGASGNNNNGGANVGGGPSVPQGECSFWDNYVMKWKPPSFF